jgi:hypothetical protein
VRAFWRLTRSRRTWKTGDLYDPQPGQSLNVPIGIAWGADGVCQDAVRLSGILAKCNRRGDPDRDRQKNRGQGRDANQPIGNDPVLGLSTWRAAKHRC